MTTNLNAATEIQHVALTPKTLNALAVILNGWAESTGAPKTYVCDPTNIREIDVQRALTLASFALGSPNDDNAIGLS